MYVTWYQAIGLDWPTKILNLTSVYVKVKLTVCYQLIHRDAAYTEHVCVYVPIFKKTKQGVLVVSRWKCCL